MLTTLRAFTWLRWRLLVNSFERTGSRDALERLSIAAEKLGPIVAGLLLIPAALALGAAGILAGYAIASTPAHPVVFQFGRFILLVLVGMALVGPIVLPSSDRTNPVRLLLLPIPHRTLYASQAAATLADPWLLLALPLLAGVPLGLLAGGAILTAVVAAAGGLLLGLVLTGLTALTATVLHMVSRDRRRGELIAMLFVVVVPLMALIPSLIDGGRRQPGEPRVRLTDRLQRMPAWIEPAVTSVGRAVPSELYLRAVRPASTGDPGAAALPLAGLAMAGLLVHGAGFALFLRVLAGPGSSTSGRARGMREFWTATLPGLSPVASAVALGHLRLVLRTPRGRAVLLTPMLIFGLFTALMWAGGGSARFGPMRLGSGLALATFAAAGSLLSILPIAMNQFAVDRAGLTMIMLSPVRDRDYLAGKAVGNLLVIAVPVVAFLPVAALLFPGGRPGDWLALPLGFVSVWVLASPIAAVLSAVFPRAVDLTSVGRGSNAHGAAGVLGLITFVAAAVPPVLTVVAATFWFRQPLLAPVFALVWLAVAVGLHHLLMGVATRVFRARREDLAMLIR